MCIPGSCFCYWLLAMFVVMCARVACCVLSCGRVLIFVFIVVCGCVCCRGGYFVVVAVVLLCGWFVVVVFVVCYCCVAIVL